MAEQDRTRDKDENSSNRSSSERAGKSGASSEQRGDNSKRDNSEWLRDQVGEDHNLSGSSTYRTLPDQPEGDSNDSGKQDAKNRQSNR